MTYTFKIAIKVFSVKNNKKLSEGGILADVILKPGRDDSFEVLRAENRPVRVIFNVADTERARRFFPCLLRYLLKKQVLKAALGSEEYGFVDIRWLLDRLDLGLKEIEDFNKSEGSQVEAVATYNECGFNSVMKQDFDRQLNILTKNRYVGEADTVTYIRNLMVQLPQTGGK